MKLHTYKKAVCGTKTNRIVTLKKDESIPQGKYYVLVNEDCSEIFIDRVRAFECFYRIVERMELTIIDESVFNIQK